MRKLFEVYRGELAKLIIGAVILVISSFGSAKEYERFKENVYYYERLQRELRISKEVLSRLKKYDNDPFWKNLGPSQEVRIYEKLGLKPLEQAFHKFSALYQEEGFFFLERLKLQTCFGKDRNRRGRSQRCEPYLEVRGRRVVF